MTDPAPHRPADARVRPAPLCRLADWAVLLLVLLIPLATVGSVIAVTTGGPAAADTATSGPDATVSCPAVGGESWFWAPSLGLPQPGTQVSVGEPMALEAYPDLEGGDFLVRFRASTGETVCADVPFGTAAASMTFSTPGDRTVVATTLSRFPTWGPDGPQPWYESPPSAAVPVTVLPVVQPDVAIALTPKSGTGETGTSRQWVATVTADGKPLAEQQVSFHATMSGAPDVSLQGQTDASGQASFQHTRATAGQDALTVSVTAYDQTATDSGNFTWIAPAGPLSVQLTTSGTSGVVGSPLEWTATVTTGGTPVPGASVRFLGQLGGQPDQDVTRTTNAAGVATHSHTRTAPGTEALSVTATADGQTATDSGSFTWLPPPGTPDVELVLTPVASGGTVGSTAVWTATVTLDGEPAPGIPVDFRGTLAGAADVVESNVLTDEDGRARHSHSRSVAGTETLTASATLASTDVTDETTWTWTAGPTTSTTGTTTGPPDTSTGTTSTTPGSPTTTGPPTTNPPSTTGPPGETGADSATDTGGPTGEDDGPPPTPIPPIDTPEPPPADAQPIDAVDLGRRSVIPGGDLAVSGAGCAPRSTVEVLLAGEVLATTTADGTGSFTVRAPVANVPLGQYVVRIRCGNGHGEAVVDLVSTVASSTAPASAASAATVLTFFVLLGSSILKTGTPAGT
ncbi:hypothetical protein GCM10009583_01940 [Ornithinicoccus hortensis]